MLSESTRPVLAGLLVGVTLSVGTSYLLRSILYGVNIVNGISFVSVSCFSPSPLFATYLPSRRAMHVDPVVATVSAGVPLSYDSARLENGRR